MKNSRTAVFLIAGILLSLVYLAGCVSSPQTNLSERTGSSGVMQNSSVTFNPPFIDTNSSPSKLPPEVHDQMWPLKQEYHFTVNKWEFDPVKRSTINLYSHDIRNATLIKDLQGKQIGNYTIYIIHDTEFEAIREEVRVYLNELRKNPDYQINSISMVTDRIHDPPENYAELWCYDSTPENKKLDNTRIKGWKILVYPVSPPPHTAQTLTVDSSNTSRP